MAIVPKVTDLIAISPNTGMPNASFLVSAGGEPPTPLLSIAKQAMFRAAYRSVPKANLSKQCGCSWQGLSTATQDTCSLHFPIRL